MDVLRGEILDRLGAAADYERFGRPVEGERLRAESAAIEWPSKAYRS